jgi:hypothetical protein
VDLNQLYFDHQLLLMKARRTLSAEARRAHEAGASLLAGRIGRMQRALGAEGAPAWEAMAADRHESLGCRPQHQLGYAS